MRGPFLAGILVALLAAAALAAPGPSKAKIHGFALSGTIASLDEQKKILIVAAAAGQKTSLVWTNATNVIGGKLAVGQNVTLRYLDKDGKHIATSIKIARTAPVTPAAVTPVPTP